MKFMSRIVIVVLLSVLMMPGFSVAQKKKEKKELTSAAAPDQATRPSPSGSGNFVHIKAIEREFGMYELSIDGGVDAEGNKKRLARSAKEEDKLNRFIEAKSLVNILAFFSKRGYEIKTSYAIPIKDHTCHYYLLSNSGNKAAKQNEDPRDEADIQQRRANQNRPKLSPEEIEQRKKAREVRNN